MDWYQIANILIPLVFVPLVAWAIKTYSKGKVNEQWANGASAAAGRVVNRVLAQLQQNPQDRTRLAAILAREVAEEAKNFFLAYGTAADTLGAEPKDANTRIMGEVGKILGPQILNAILAPPQVVNITADAAETPR